LKENFFNPIDKDKTTDKPSLLPYAHHVGSAIIKPLDKGRVKGNAMKAMFQQTENQLGQIKEQVEILIKQAQEIHDRISISERIYTADCGIKPIIDKEYYLFERETGVWFLSMIAPEEWGKGKSFTYIATVRLLADHTWQVVDKNPDKTIEIT
jgi:hypothetical protein